MKAEIKVLREKKFIGIHREMSLSNDSTYELWRNLMKQQHLIKNRIGDKFYNVKIFDKNMDFKNFDATTLFQKWAVVEVADVDDEIKGFNHLTLSGGKYAVFVHRGPASTFHHTLQYIFEEWLPTSPYTLDDRAHFERFTKDYRAEDPHATEEVWIPIT